jgi:uncharacterized protein with GYD domain
MFAEQEKLGIKNLGIYWTLGRYDAVRIYEAPDEKTALRGLTRAPEHIQTETLVAIRREEVAQLLEK